MRKVPGKFGWLIARQTAAAALLLAVVLAAQALQLREQWRVTPRYGVHEFDQRERLFDAIKPHLRGHAKVGFVTQRDGSEEPLRDRAGIEFLRTQYTLAPVVLEKTMEHPFVVASFHETPDLPAPELPGLDLILDMGQGIALYHRSQR